MSAENNIIEKSKESFLSWEKRRTYTCHKLNVNSHFLYGFQNLNS